MNISIFHYIVNVALYLYLQALLLLTQLTKGNTNLQKIVAFENAFERLLDIVRDEGNSDGGTVYLFIIQLCSTSWKFKRIFHS